MATALLVACIAWVPVLLVAIANELLFIRWLSPRHGHGKAVAFSLPSLVVLLFACSIWVVHLLGIATVPMQLATGAVWIALTVLFEFLFWHFVGKKSWADIGARFHPRSGDGTLLLLLVIGLLPVLAGFVPQQAE